MTEYNIGAYRLMNSAFGYSFLSVSLYKYKPVILGRIFTHNLNYDLGPISKNNYAYFYYG